MKDNNIPVVSIIIPTYNMERYIARCLDSVIIPEIEDIDVIVVNDGSTDKSHDIAISYANKYPASIRVIDKVNGHYGTTINCGLEAARGKYFRILDSDDYFESDQLSRFVHILKDCDADLIVTARTEEQTYDEKIKYVCVKDVEYGKTYPYPSFSIQNHSTDDGEFNMHTMTYKTEVLRKIGLKLPGGVCYTDMIYCMAPLNVTNSIVIYDLNLYHYIIGRDGSSTTGSEVKKNLKHICVVLEYMFAYCNNNHTSRDIQKDRERYIKEALSFFFASILKHRHIEHDTCRKISTITHEIKLSNVSHHKLNKYYIKPWFNHTTYININLWLIIYKILHPFK